MTQTSSAGPQGKLSHRFFRFNSLNHHFSSASIATWLWEESKIDSVRINGSTYVEKGGARSEGGEASRDKVNVSGCVMSLRERGLGRYESFRRCRSENRR